jgi:hypothetical protein
MGFILGILYPRGSLIVHNTIIEVLQTSVDIDVVDLVVVASGRLNTSSSLPSQYYNKMHYCCS